MGRREGQGIGALADFIAKQKEKNKGKQLEKNTIKRTEWKIFAGRKRCARSVRFVHCSNFSNGCAPAHDVAGCLAAT
jgi:hypothetical protein